MENSTMRWHDDSRSRRFLQTLQTSAQVAGSSSREIAARAGAMLRLVAPLLIELSAIAALAYGCHLAWRPLGFIVPGALVFGLSVFADLRSSSALKNSRGKKS